MLNHLIVRAAGLVATGLAGAAAYDAVKRVARSASAHDATVTATAWGLRGVRAAETGAEKVRLATADIVSEARSKIGEETLPPTGMTGHGHEH